MVRVRRAIGWLLLAIVIALPRSAFADDDVTVLTPPSSAPATNATPALAAKEDVKAFIGLPIVRVDVVLEDLRWPDVRPPTLTSLRAGDRVSEAALRAALDEAVRTGAFADGRIGLDHEAGGALVTIHLMPRKIVDSIVLDLHGAPLNGDNLLRDVDLAADGELVAREIVSYEKRIENVLQQHGFPTPQVNLTTRGTTDPLRVIVLINVDAGPPRRVERRVFYPRGGTPGEIDSAQQRYALKPGDRADETTLAAADAELEGRIRSRGWHRAQVTHDVVLHRGIVVLRVRLDFGARYETRYEGNDHYDKHTLDDILELEKETDRTPNHLTQKVREYYVKHGFLDADVRLEQRSDPQSTVSYLVFHVIEGARVYVAARSYPCLREDDVKKLPDAPTSARAIGSEIDSFLEEELPGNDLFVPPHAEGLDRTIGPVAMKGSRPVPLELEPYSVYVPDTYERAVQHVQELYRAEGFLSAQVGPVQVVRRRCSPKSPPGECVPLPVPLETADVCTFDAVGLPLPVPPLEQGSTCVPDRAHGVDCESRVWLRVPVKLGPRTQLWGIAFTGTAAIAPKHLADAADVKLGDYVSTTRLEEARRRVADAYKEEGYAFVDVKYLLEPSPDRTRARVRFLVTEGEQVMVRDIVVRGNVGTNEYVIKRRVALQIGRPYRASDVRKTEERVATLGPFSSVSVALENPYIPQKNKVVVITVVERPRQYTEVAPGFSTGEGFRLRTEYGHNNLWGNGVQLTLRLQLAYIPTGLIIDPVARENYRELERSDGLIARIGYRLTGSIVLPEVGLGPLVRVGADAIFAHDLQRDFFLTKVAVIPNINFRPAREIQISFFQSVEFNNNRIFQADNTEEYLRQRIAAGLPVAPIFNQLLVPDGETYAFAQRLLVTWDRRDNAFNATKGTYVVSAVEHVDAYPVDPSRERSYESHFFKLTQTLGGYIPLPKGLRIAALTRIGANVHLTNGSRTYPDRLFFMGGVDTMRGWNFYAFIPQETVDGIFNTQNEPDTLPDPANPGQTITNPNKITPGKRPINGGDFMVLERVEIRIPIRGPFETVVFADIGNLWIDPAYPFDNGRFPIRAAVGSGLRVQTPVGPLAVDYGFNVTRLPYEDPGAINFAIGLF